MPVKRCSAQKSKTLQEFYTEVSLETDYTSPVIGRSMLSFIEMIDRTFKNTTLWGLTSHYRMVILSKDDAGSKWYIIVTATADGGYDFQYKMPADKSPWEGAAVTGYTRGLEGARRFLLISMIESRGWADNTELQELSAQYLQNANRISPYLVPSFQP